jgi:hypothetical protein
MSLDSPVKKRNSLDDRGTILVMGRVFLFATASRPALDLHSLLSSGYRSKVTRA